MVFNYYHSRILHIRQGLRHVLQPLYFAAIADTLSEKRSAAGRLTAATAGNGEDPAGSAAAAGLFCFCRKDRPMENLHTAMDKRSLPTAMHRFPTVQAVCYFVYLFFLREE